jgi:hypothetical protein
MNRNDASTNDESEAFRRAVESDLIIGRNNRSDASIEMSQLRVLCIGMAGMIVADALVLIYFWTI